ncbi:uncharacterized protein [Amphiura filiformis]|uniref:uncharacterized protein n=1 Tax=Amphiura filiformis TaxID=82378 RepID=UPI003B2273C9
MRVIVKKRLKKICFILFVIMFVGCYFGYGKRPVAPELIKLREMRLNLTHHSYAERPIAPEPIKNYPSGRFYKLRLNLSSVVPSVSTDQHDQECNLLRFDPSTKPDKHVTCKRVKPLKDSCNIAADLFLSQPAETCSYQKTYNICEVIKDAKDTPSARCSHSMCKNSSIVLGIADWNQGIVEWSKIQNAAKLEAQIQSLVEQPPEKPNFGFCFIKCIVVEQKKVVIDNKVKKEYVHSNASQLLLLPPQIATSNLSGAKTYNAVNINLIWLDSLSHSHFMRSMPATIKSLKTIQRQETGYVFSYNLFQALKYFTLPNSRALFSGEVSNRNGNIQSQLLLGRYKRGGYATSWSDDLCWKHKWGLAKKLGTDASNWTKIKDAIPQAGIDRIDMTLSACEALNGRSYFNVHKEICYNGKSQQFYIFSYLAELQKQLQKHGKPYFHYTETNVAHEDTGRRIQTFDEDLANYLRSLSTQKNTLTVLLADHGNNYGRLFSKTFEAEVEMYHPMLVIHASKDLPQIIGEDKMTALALNQDRLVSILDLHYALHTLAPEGSIEVATEHAKYNVEPMGLFAPIDVNRTCDSTPILDPNGCICERNNTKYVANDTRHMMLAEFALGEINNMIRSQFRAKHPDAATGFGSCQRLSATWFGNVRDTSLTGAVSTQLAIYVPAGNNASQDEDVFWVTVLKSDKYKMNLTDYKRISRYGPYKECADDGVDIKLCICSLIRPISRPDYMTIPSWHSWLPDVFQQNTTTKALGNSNCLFIFQRITKSGMTVEASSECSKKSYFVEVKADILNNVFTTLPLPYRVMLNPGDMVFLLVFIPKNQNAKWTFRCKANILREEAFGAGNSHW